MSIDNRTIEIDDNRYVPAMPDERDAAAYDDILDQVDTAFEMAMDALVQSLAVKFPQFVVVVDKRPQFVVGQDDPTPGPDDLGQDRQCYADDGHGLVCTWPKDHGDYPHVAGDGTTAVAVWR